MKLPKEIICKSMTLQSCIILRRDPDNYSGKFILDGLVKAGIIADDSFSNIDLRLCGKVDKKNPRTEIEITNDSYSAVNESQGG